MSYGNIQWHGPVQGAVARLLLTHGAGVGLDSEFMAELVRLLAGRDVRVAAFEFPYMQKMRADGRRRPPDRAPVLLQCWRDAWQEVQACEPGSWAIGGKSMGGRMASMVAGELPASGLVCLGYPFHPPGKPEKLRIDHLQLLRHSALIIQGERDAFGGRQEVAAYNLSNCVELYWLAAADHDFRPLKRSGYQWQQHLQSSAEQIVDFLRRVQG